jgi:hypothetical protein
MITKVNKGVCQWRATNNKPSFFVNWQENGQNKYQFFFSVSGMYDLFNKLKQND